MARWLDAGCRDWRRESSEDAEEIVVSAIYAMPIQAQKLRVQIAKNVEHWGFIRRGHVKEHRQFLTVDSYMEGGTGELVRARVLNMIQGAVDKFETKKKNKRQVSQEELGSRLAAFREKQRKKCVPELRLALKGFWTNVEMDCGIKRKEKGWYSFRDDPVVRRRRARAHR